MKTAFLFPGQGAQYAGMGKDFYDESPRVHELFEESSDITGKDIAALLFESDEATLMETENTQITVMLVSIASAYVLQERGVQPDMVVGFSLGEYAALVVSNIISVKDACALVAQRGAIMESCGAAVREQYPNEGDGGMTAVLGMNPDDIVAHLAQWSIPRAHLAMYNSPIQGVIAGTAVARETACEQLAQAGARKSIPLKVSGPFHTPLMQKAKDQFAEVIRSVEFADPAMPMFSNVSGAKVTAGNEMRELCLEQLVKPVRWIDEERAVADEQPARVLEVGPGTVLTGLWKAWRKAQGDETIPECAPAGTMEQVADLCAAE